MKKQVVAPRLPTPVTPSAGSSSVRLPDDVVAEQVSRLKLFALVSGGMWLIGLIMDGLGFPERMPYQVTRSTIVIEIVAVLFAAAIYLHLKFSGRPPRASHSDRKRMITSRVSAGSMTSSMRWRAAAP